LFDGPVERRDRVEAVSALIVDLTTDPWRTNRYLPRSVTKRVEQLARKFHRRRVANIVDGAKANVSACDDDF
jgi:hypothetical protein